MMLQLYLSNKTIANGHSGQKCQIRWFHTTIYAFYQLIAHPERLYPDVTR